MPLTTDVASALTALERHRGPLSEWQQGQLAAWKQRGDPSPVERDRIGSLLGRPAAPRSQSTTTATPTPCPHCGRRPSERGLL